MYLLNVKISPIQKNELLNSLLRFLEDGKKHHIVTTNPEFVVEAQSNKEFCEVINSADLSLPDGIGILVAIAYAQRRKRTANKWISLFYFICDYGAIVFFKRMVAYHDKPIERISGVDLVLLLVQQEWMKGRKIYLLGGMDTVSSLAMKRLQQINPDIQFKSSKGFSNIRQTLQSSDLDKESAVIQSDISTFNPDVLLVAYGHPWQDLWIDRNKVQIPFRIAIGVGGTFDYLAGRVPRAPVWMRKLGLEWLFRLLKQPHRFNRIKNATWLFMQKIIASDTILS